MPARIVFRRGVGNRNSRVTQFYRRSSVVPGGQTKRVAPGSSRNAPIYAYQRPSQSARKLVHFSPLLSVPRLMYAHQNNILYPTIFPNQLLLNGIAQGDGIEARHANKAWMRDLQLNYKAFIPSANFAKRYNVLVVYDRECRGTYPALADLLDNPASLLAMQRVVNRERFDIIFRKEMVFAPQMVYDGTGLSAFDTSLTEADYSFRIPVNRMAFYSGTSDQYSDILKGGLYLFLWNTSLSTDADKLRVDVCARLEFVDVE